MRHALPLLCSLLLAACSAEVSVETEPLSQAIPITSVLEPVYVEVAVDLPPETQGLDVTVQEVGARLTVYNPSQGFTLQTSARLSFTGTATPDTPKFYSEASLPPYFRDAEVLMPTREFAPASRTPVTIDSPMLARAIGRERIWLIISNTVTRAGLGGVLPLEIRLQDVVLHATVTRPFDGLAGVLEVGGL